MGDKVLELVAIITFATIPLMLLGVYLYWQCQIRKINKEISEWAEKMVRKEMEELEQ